MSAGASIQANPVEKDGASQSEYKLKVLDLIAKFLTLIVLAVGGALGLAKYYDERNEYFAEREQEYQFALYKERKEMYSPLCKAAAEIVMSTSLAGAKESIKTFQTLYFAGVRNIADQEANEAIRDFMESLQDFMSGPDDAPPPSDLRQLADVMAGNLMRLNLKNVFKEVNSGNQEGSAVASVN